MPSLNLPAQYRFADHVRACSVDGQVILLDLLRNKYMGIGGPQVSEMSRLIADWPPGDGALRRPAGCTELKQPLATMLAAGMLTEKPGTNAPKPPICSPLESLEPEDVALSMLSESRHLLMLGLSAVIASHWLRHRSLMDIAKRVEHLRQGGRPPSEPADATGLRALVTSFMRLRPFVLTSHDECLRDSLSLIGFLARKGVFPQWVIGVRTRPFAAHSWVQSGSIVVNDIHENVRAYTPILVV